MWQLEWDSNLRPSGRKALNLPLRHNSPHRNRKLLISRAPTKAKSQEPACSQALNQNKIDRHRSRSRESGRQTVRRLSWMALPHTCTSTVLRGSLEFTLNYDLHYVI